MSRYAVRHRCNPDEYLGGTSGKHRPRVAREQAFLWRRKNEATKAARANGSAQVVEVELRFLTASGVTQICE